MKYRVEVTSAATADIEAAYLYIQRDSPENARNWRLGLYSAAASLEQFPHGCGFALENDVLPFDVRQKLYGNYRILFTVDETKVVILRVRHAARLPLRRDDF